LGNKVSRDTKLDENVMKELLKIGEIVKETNPNAVEDIVSGRTLCAHDFYEGMVDMLCL
jgi:hypothetical protein